MIQLKIKLYNLKFVFLNIFKKFNLRALFKIIKCYNSLTIHFPIRIDSIFGNWLRVYSLCLMAFCPIKTIWRDLSNLFRKKLNNYIF